MRSAAPAGGVGSVALVASSMALHSEAKVALALSGVCKSFGQVLALDGLTFSVEEGRFFALFGPSAVGKTTALRAISGLVQPEEGRIAIAGKDVTRAPVKGRDIAMVFQSFALYPHLTVYRNLAYPLVEEGVATIEIDKRVRETAEMLRLAASARSQTRDAVGRRAATRGARTGPRAKAQNFVAGRAPDQSRRQAQARHAG